MGVHAFAKLLAAGLCATLSASCYSQGETTCGQEANSKKTLRGRVLDAATGLPLEGSIVAVELCGIYTRNVDPAKAHPNYLYGALTAADGTFSVDVPGGRAGLHTFKDGYRYGFADLADLSAGEALVRAQPLLPSDARPVVSNVRVEPAEPAGRSGGDAELKISAQVAAGSSKDPLSEEVIVFEPKTGLLRALAPPSRGRPGKAYPNGVWTATVKAPTMPGEYAYQVVVTTEQCITGNRVGAKVVVP